MDQYTYNMHLYITMLLVTEQDLLLDWPGNVPNLNLKADNIKNELPLINMFYFSISVNNNFYLFVGILYKKLKIFIVILR